MLFYCKNIRVYKDYISITSIFSEFFRRGIEMSLHEYGRTEFSILQFTFKVTDDIKEKIAQKKLLHNDDIVQYIHRQMDHFFQKFNLKPALLQTYKNEVLNSVMFKLKASNF